MKTLSLEPQWDQPASALRHTWERVVNVDQCRWLLRHDLLAQLEIVQRELGGRHVRAVGLYDDEMRVLCPGPETFGEPEPRVVRTNWQVVDSMWDALLARGLAPMITTSFIPSRLAGGPTTVFTTRGHTSPPRDYAQWSALVSESARHAIDRYGLAVVRAWYFEVWNEPNLRNWFWGGDQADFFKFWDCTWRALKSVHPDLRVGGPSTARAEWLAEFLEFSRRQDCPPDYLTLHIYNNDGDAAALAPFAGPQEDKAGTSPNLAAGVIRGSRRLADELGFDGEIHFNEWGRSWRPIEPDRESANEAAFIVRTMAEVSQEADEFAYWCASDIYDQVGYGREPFHGGYGLLNLHGLRKPSYHAFTLLHRLGTERIEVRGSVDSFNGAIATRSRDRLDVLVYAYRHDCAAAIDPIRVSVTLPTGTVPECTLYRVDRSENNCAARWRGLGSPAYPHPNEIAALRAEDPLQPSAAKVEWVRQGAGWLASFAMESAGIALLSVPCPSA
ncbi:MAG: hypothetical protein JWM32_270 [Verrucomicrobia bacterium]|nr:hypothetical protein [Verrucomicrobiota bacterium]